MDSDGQLENSLSSYSLLEDNILLLDSSTSTKLVAKEDKANSNKQVSVQLWFNLNKKLYPIAITYILFQMNENAQSQADKEKSFRSL